MLVHTIRFEAKKYRTSKSNGLYVFKVKTCLSTFWFFQYFHFSLRLVDGVEVIQETQTPSTTPVATHGIYSDGLASSSGLGGIHNLSNLKSSPPLGITMTDYTPPSGHADVISDITMVQGSQSYIVSASKDGVIKVWK